MYTGLEQISRIQEVVQQNPWLRPYLAFLAVGPSMMTDEMRVKVVDNFIRTRIQNFSEYAWQNLCLTEKGVQTLREDVGILASSRFAVLYKVVSTGQIEHLDHIYGENGEVEVQVSSQMLMKKILGNTSTQNDNDCVEFLGVIRFACIIMPGENRPSYDLKLYRHPPGYLPSI